MPRIKFAAAVALAAGLVAGPANAVVVNFDFSGTFEMYDPSGALMWHDETLTGTISMDMVTFGGTATMQDSTPFYGSYWTAHDIQLSMHPDFSVNSHMLFDWNVTSNIDVYTQFQMTPSVVNPIFDPFNVLTWMVGDQFTVSSNDADGDGTPGNALKSGPFVGFSPSFSGNATISGFDLLGHIPNNNIPAVDPVPVPAAVWLFGSGLLALIGMTRRKNT